MDIFFLKHSRLSPTLHNQLIDFIVNIPAPVSGSHITKAITTVHKNSSSELYEGVDNILA